MVTKNTTCSPITFCSPGSCRCSFFICHIVEATTPTSFHFLKSYPHRVHGSLRSWLCVCVCVCVVCVCVLVVQSCLTLCDPVDCSPPGFSVHGILQARILELPCPSPGELPDPGIKPMSSALQADSLPSEPAGKPLWSWLVTENRLTTSFTFLTLSRKGAGERKAFSWWPGALRWWFQHPGP